MQNKKLISSLEIQKELLRRDISIFSNIQFTRLFVISSNRANRALGEAVRDGVIARVKQGLYYLVAKPPTAFEIANVLYGPSYISLETALSYHRVIPENVYTIKSITPKHTRFFTAINRDFSYSKINKRLFFGYQKMMLGGRPVIMAEREKAFLDYAYFVVRGLKRFNDRFDLSKIDKKKLGDHIPYFRGVLIGRKLKAFDNLIDTLLT